MINYQIEIENKTAKYSPISLNSSLSYYVILFKLGDWLIFEDMGAYTVTIAAPFNGFQTPSIRRVMRKKIWDALVCPAIIEEGYGTFCS